MTMTVIILNLAMSLPALVALIAAALLVLRLCPENPGREGRADWRGPFGRRLDGRRIQCTAASIATATNSSAR
jgi:hypothetical protein